MDPKLTEALTSLVQVVTAILAIGLRIFVMYACG